MPRPEKPIDPDDGPLATFAYALRMLRREAGNPGYRQLAQQTEYSITVLSQAAGGVRLPTWQVTESYVQACRGDLLEWRQRWEIAAAAARVGATDGQQTGKREKSPSEPSSARSREPPKTSPQQPRLPNKSLPLENQISINDIANLARIELCHELRRLWQAAEVSSGIELKVKALARRLHISPSSVYAYFDGTTLPSSIVLDRILHELGASDLDKKRLAELREDEDQRRRTERRGGVTKTKVMQVASPWQLPSDVRGFTGRTPELARLDGLLTAREEFSAPTIALLSGTAGVGKTALAVHWAHRRRGRFPHGLLYADLHGFDPDQPREPEQVLGNFLRVLGVQRNDVPTDLADRAALFRALLDQRRMLILLDNAASDEQVRPLLPNSPHSVVIVTSRNSLNGLIARHGAHHLRVPHLPIDDAVSLLQVLIGDNRVDDDQVGAVRLVERCALLPLAIRIGAELASTRRRSRLTELADELGQYHLDLFSAGGDERTAIRTVFSWSYLHLRVDRARAFRLLGLHPGQDLDVHTCAALMDVNLLEARLRIDDLVRANLIEEAGDDRYHMHDLLRAYAREEAERCDPTEVGQVMLRLFDHYLQTGATAMTLIASHGTVSSAAGEPRTRTLRLANWEHAMDWLDAERHNLLTMAEVAANGDWPQLTSKFSALLSRHLDTRACYHDAMALHTLALKVARNQGRHELAAWEHLRIGIVHLRLGRFDEAKDNFANALTIAEDNNDPVLVCRSLLQLGQTHLVMGQEERACDLLNQALAQASDDLLVGSHVLSGLGAANDRLGRRDEALARHYEAYSLAVDLADNELLGQVLVNLGRHYAGLDLDKAKLCYQRALHIARKLGNPALEAGTLLELGIVMMALDRVDDAHTVLTDALVLAASIGARHIEDRVRDELDDLPKVFEDGQRRRPICRPRTKNGES